MLKAVITTLVLGTSTIAMADTPYPDTPYDTYPETTYPDTTYPGTPYTDRRGDYIVHPDHSDFRRRPVVLADNVILGSRYQRPIWVPIHARYGISSLRLQLQTGRTFVESVTVVYADGHREIRPVRQLLSWRIPSITISLTHPGVQGVFIDSAPMRGPYARGGGWRRNPGAVVDVIGLRR